MDLTSALTISLRQLQYIVAVAERGRTRLTVDVLDGARVLLLDDGHCFRDQVLELRAPLTRIADTIRQALAKRKG